MYFYDEIIDSSDSVGQKNSIAIDSNDNPHIAYCDNANNNVKYAKWDGSSWQTEIVTSEENLDDVREASIAIDSNDNPHLCFYYGYTVNSALYENIAHATLSEGAWNITIIEDSAEHVYDNSIAIDSNDNPHVAWYHKSYIADEGGSLNYAKYDGSSWQITLEIDGPDNYKSAGLYNSIDIDSNDNPHIGYTVKDTSEYIYYLKYAKYDGASWNINTLFTVDNTAIESHMTLDSNDNPHISYSYSLYLKYKKYDGNSWTTSTISSNDEIDRNCIALNNNNQPHISSYNENKNLRYDKWDGSSWQTEIINSSDDIGLYNSIDIDSNDNPHISYYNNTNNDLEYTTIEYIDKGLRFLENDQVKKILVSRSYHSSNYDLKIKLEDSQEFKKYGIPIVETDQSSSNFRIQINGQTKGFIVEDT